VTVLRQSAPIRIVPYYPQTGIGKAKLAKQVSDLHAAVVLRQIKDMTCPVRQKQQLLDAIITAVRLQTSKTDP
jgi:predicted flavoprotein YhiN